MRRKPSEIVEVATVYSTAFHPEWIQLNSHTSVPALQNIQLNSKKYICHGAS